MTALFTKLTTFVSCPPSFRRKVTDEYFLATFSWRKKCVWIVYPTIALDFTSWTVMFWMWREHLTRKSEDLSSHPVFSIYYQPDDCGHMQFCSLNFNVFICKIEMFLPVTISLMDITLGESNKITYAKEICKSRLLQMCYIFHFCLAKSWGLGFYRTDVTVKKGPRNLDIQIKYSYFNHLFNVICQNCG